MLVSPTVMRVLLFTCMLGMVVVAGLYLRRQRLTPLQYLAWGALILLAPFVGPFLAILLGPGHPHEELTARQRRLRRKRRRLVMPEIQFNSEDEFKH
jgi:hypothetical protein